MTRFWLMFDLCLVVLTVLAGVVFSVACFSSKEAPMVVLCLIVALAAAIFSFIILRSYLTGPLRVTGRVSSRRMQETPSDGMTGGDISYFLSVGSEEFEVSRDEYVALA